MSTQFIDRVAVSNFRKVPCRRVKFYLVHYYLLEYVHWLLNKKNTVSALSYFPQDNFTAWSLSQIARIHSRCVTQGTCFIWQGATNNGYGRKRMRFLRLGPKYKAYYTHRLVYMLSTGDCQLPKGTNISHLCGESLCANPDHLCRETHRANCGRRRCVDKGTCKRTHEPACVS